MVAEPLTIEFHEDHRGPVVQRMATMAEAHRGWVNFSPGLDLDVPPAPRSLMSSLFTARGPEVPLATWSPGDGSREPATIGIQHGKGPRVLEQLTDGGIALPEGWRKLQDHPKRGLVCVVPQDRDDPALDGVLQWLLRASGHLCPVPRTGEWRALCYHAI